jgi:hypothetical protein
MGNSNLIAPNVSYLSELTGLFINLFIFYLLGGIGV